MPPKAAREPVGALQHRAKRKNLPPAGLESHGRVGSEAPHRYEFNPHLPPALRSSPEAGDADLLPDIVREAQKRALNEQEAQILADALRRHEPWLEWAGKRERPWFEVDPVALHMHERVSTEALLRAVRRKDVQRSLFGDPELEYAKAVQFYRHDVDWTNRLILGDSLQVMASLARREDLAGKVQMIYVDPPYGISFRSNFQPDLGRRDVKDRAQDLTREPEMVRAYRDTWTLGVHSYLAYLRDRLAMAHELLAATGSIFVQISDENVHRVRCVMDEVFGKDNAVVTIIFKKKGATVPTASVHDYLLWYAKDAERKKVIPLATGRGDATADPKFRTLMAPSGETIPAARLTSEELARLLRNGWHWCRVDYPIVSQDPDPSRSRDYRFQGQPRKCGANKHWRFDVPAGLDRLARAERLFSGTGHSVGGVVFWEDRGRSAISNLWTDTKGEESPVYSVQTARKVVERCLLMTTDPGDLVLDPTCGSGTTPFVAEKWGRRWIAIDTSRVALTLAKHRLITAIFDNYRLRKPNAQDLQRNPDGPWLSGQDHAGRATGEPATLDLKTVPHVTLKSIARNVSLDPIFEKHEPVLASALKDLNAATVPIEEDTRATLVAKLVAKHRERGARSVTDADLRRWLLPGTSLAVVRPERVRGPLKALTAAQIRKYEARVPGGSWQDWEVPFDADPDWPAPLREALAAYRTAWRAKMDEVNACIAANAESEELVDQPHVESGAARVAGPFSVEGVIALEEGPDTPIGGAPEELEPLGADATEEAVQNGEAHIAKVIRLLRASGVEFPRQSPMRFARLEAAIGALLHAEGEWEQGDRRVAVSVGPEVGNLTALQVERALRDANQAGYDDLVFAAFGFDATAQEAVQNDAHPDVRCHMALISPDVAMGELLKTQPGSQIFTVFAAPRVGGPESAGDGEYRVTMEGMDVYDPVGNRVLPTNRDRVAAWFLDTDYDGRTFCICQAFFPDRSKWDRLAGKLDDLGLADRESFAELSGFDSLGFRRPERLGPGDSWRVAVKVIDPRGVEGLRVLNVGPPQTEQR